MPDELPLSFRLCSCSRIAGRMFLRDGPVRKASQWRHDGISQRWGCRQGEWLRGHLLCAVVKLLDVNASAYYVIGVAATLSGGLSAPISFQIRTALFPESHGRTRLKPVARDEAPSSGAADRL